MGKIALVDDDFASEALIEHLQAQGHDARRFKSAEEAIRHIDELAKLDLIIIDIQMERPEGLSEAPSRGGYRTGLELAKQIRAKAPDIKLVAWSATTDLEVIDYFRHQPNCSFYSKLTFPSLKEFGSTIHKLLGGTNPRPVKSFIVHGHDDVTTLALKNFLQNTIKLPEPTILREQPNKGRTIIEKLEHDGAGCDLVFVLLTPDDIAAKATDPDDEKRRARQNVIFEMGYFLGILGRHSGRILLLFKGPLELPSDLAGIVYIDISGGIPAAGEQIRKEIDHVLAN